MNASSREIGRPKIATDELRDNNYRDEDGRYQVSELKPWHERVSELMLLEPHLKIVDLAKRFDVTPQWMGMLLRSDAFREFHSGRLHKHTNVMEEAIFSRLQSVTVHALDVMKERLEAKDASFGMAKDAAGLALRSLDYISDSKGGVNVKAGKGGQVIVAVSSEVVDRARTRLQERMKANGSVLEHQPAHYQQVTSAVQIQAEDLNVTPNSDDS